MDQGVSRRAHSVPGSAADDRGTHAEHKRQDRRH